MPAGAAILLAKAGQHVGGEGGGAQQQRVARQGLHRLPRFGRRSRFRRCDKLWALARPPALPKVFQTGRITDNDR